MNIDKINSMSYAAVLRNSLPRKRYNSECVQKTWFDQLIEFEQDEFAMRSASLSHLPSEVETTNCHTFHNKNTNHPLTSSTSSSYRNSIESLDPKSLGIDSDSCIETMDTCSEDKFSHNDIDLGYERPLSVISSSGCSTQTIDCKSRTESSSSDIFETDEEVLARRQKQIDYGKATAGYKCYRKKVPIFCRTKDHPRTPNKHRKYSRRGFDGLIKKWRIQLHQFDPNATATKQNIDVERMEEF